MVAAVVALAALLIGPVAGAFPRSCVVSDRMAAPISCGCHCSEEAKAVGGCCCQTSPSQEPADLAERGTAPPAGGVDTCPSGRGNPQHSSCPCQLRPAPSEPAATVVPTAHRQRWSVDAMSTPALLPTGWTVAESPSLSGSSFTNPLWALGSQTTCRPDAGRAPPTR